MPTGDGRCRKEPCKALKAKLADEIAAHKSTARELQRLQAHVRSEIKGGIRRWDAESGVPVIKGELDELKRVAEKNKRWARDACQKAREMVGEIADLHNSQADLTRELADLKKKSAQQDVAHRYELCKLGREMRSQEASTRAGAERVARETLAEAHKETEACREAAAEAQAQAQAQAQAVEAQAQAAEAEAEAEAAEAVGHARRLAEAAKVQALELTADLRAAEEKQDDTAWLLLLTEKREARAKKKNAELQAKISDVAPPVREMSADEWAALSREAAYVAHHRAQKRIDSILCSHSYQAEDLATVLHKHGLLEKIFDTHAGFDIYYERVRKLMCKLEEEDYGVSFALYLRYELRLTMPKIFEVTKAACKRYNRASDRYSAKVILYHRHRKGVFIKVPRLAPPPSKLCPIIKSVEAKLGCEHSADGSIAFRPVATVFQDMMARDPGTHGMPKLPFYLGGAHPVPIVVQWDATGYGKLQLTTAAVRNPYLPMSAQQLHLFGIGNCGDGKSGTKELFGPNIDTLNGWISSAECTECIDVEIDGTLEKVQPHVYISTDVSALRHTEHLANSGWCCCSRDFALRTTSKKPESYAEMLTLLKQCKSPTAVERFDLAHEPRPGETVPRPCPACSFGHGDEAETMQRYAALLATEKQMSAVDTKAGKAAYSKWRMAHAFLHSNVQPGEHGRPLLHYNLDDFILDMLHLAELGAPKTPWKHGILNNASDDAREKISNKLKEWKHPLDCRRKDDNRSRAQKWFTGEAWASFCAGESGSPGGPQGIAELVMIIADDMQRRGVTIGGGTAEAPTPPQPKQTGKAAAAARNAATLAIVVAQPARQQQAQLTHVPTAIELAADPADLQVIRDVYGSRAQTIINTLLSFDAYFNWYYPLKDHKLGVLDDDKEKMLARAFENCRTAIDLHEICERLSIRNHKSFLFHGAIFKVTRDIMKVGNVWAFGTSSLELANADTKRVADQAASRRTQFCDYTKTRVPLNPGFSGPMRLTETQKQGTTMAISTLNFLLTRGVLRRGDGLVCTPESRRAERLFGVGGSGRSSNVSAGCKLEKLSGSCYDACVDSCIKAFVRLMAAAAAAVGDL